MPCLVSDRIYSVAKKYGFNVLPHWNGSGEFVGILAWPKQWGDLMDLIMHKSVPQYVFLEAPYDGETLWAAIEELEKRLSKIKVGSSEEA